MRVPFQGEDRHALVERLLALYDEVDVEGAQPRWVALEAPSGWGKTRIVQELYAALVATRRGRPEAPGAYWPADIVSDEAREGEDVHATRKVIHPRVVQREGGSLPPFLWWGISCSARNGVASVALREDLVQLQAHQPFVVARCLQLDPLSVELRRSSRDLARHVAGEAGSTLESGLVDAATSALNVAVPGIGLVWSIGKWGFSRVVDRHERSQQVARASSIDTGAADDVLADTVGTLRSVARPGLPLVVVVEDLQLADATLVDLLEELLGSGRPILLVTTSWPGALDEPPLDALLHTAAGRVLRVRATDSNSDSDSDSGSGSGSAGDLAPLDAAARERIVAAIHPGVTAATAALLAERFENPLLLELACGLGWVREEVDPVSGRLELTRADVEEIPADAAGLYTAMWERLSEPARRALALAVSAIPHEVSAEVGANRWLAGPLVAAVREALPQAPEVAAHLAGTTPGWTRPVRDAFAAYLEPLAQRTAASHEHLNRASRVRAVQGHLFEQARRQLTEGAVDELLDLHAADLVIAWQLSGLAHDPVAFGIAVIEHTNSLGPHTEDSTRTLSLADRALELLEPTGEPAEVAAVRTNLGLARANALLALGRARESADAYGELADALARQEGEGGRRALEARHDRAAALVEAADLDAALALLEDLVGDERRHLGPTDPMTVASLQVTSVVLSRMGRTVEALARDRELLDLVGGAFGPDHDLTLAARNNVAINLAALGRPDLAADELQAVLEARTRLFGGDHPVTLLVRANLAGELRRCGRTEQAREERAAVLADQRRVLGPEHDDTLDSVMRLARLESDVGNHEAALAAAREVVAHRSRRHGDDDARTARARRQLASILGEAGELEPALAEARRALDVQVRMVGRRHVEALDTAAVIGLLLAVGDRPEEAHPVFTELYAARLDLAGPDDPGTLEARFGLLSTAAGADAAAVRAEMAVDYARALGPDHHETLAMRRAQARCLVEEERFDEAVEVLGRLAEDGARLDLSRTQEGLEVRTSWSTALLRCDRWQEAVAVLAPLVADRLDLLPEHDALTLVLRHNHAVALSHVPRTADALGAFQRLCEDQERLVGRDDPELLDTLDAWREAVEPLVAGQRLDEAEPALVGLLSAHERVLGPDADDTATVREQLRRVRHDLAASGTDG